jgi:ABC-type lipoprotein export system ATPase subunit
MKTPALISATGLTKTYRRGSEEVRALDGVSFEINRGEFVAVVGPSGAGKSTLLNLLGAMDTPTSGSLKIAGQALENAGDSVLTRLRREKIGFVFQHFGLIPILTVFENVLLPGVFAHRPSAARVDALLEKIGLNHRRRHLPRELSGGEMQRVAIARALVNEPEILLADEPTGNLDSQTGETIISLFKQLSAEGLTVVAVTHNPELIRAGDRRLTLADGKIAI